MTIEMLAGARRDRTLGGPRCVWGVPTAVADGTAALRYDIQTRLASHDWRRPWFSSPLPPSTVRLFARLSVHVMGVDTR
jgi:hypothetical protein